MAKFCQQLVLWQTDGRTVTMINRLKAQNSWMKETGEYLAQERFRSHWTITYGVWSADEGVLGTPLLDDIPDQVFLAVVGGQYGDLVRRVAQQSHVHKHGHHILRLTQILYNTERKVMRQIIKIIIMCLGNNEYRSFFCCFFKPVKVLKLLYSCIIDKYWYLHQSHASLLEMLIGLIAQLVKAAVLLLQPVTLIFEWRTAVVSYGPDCALSALCKLRSTTQDRCEKIT